MGLGKTLQSVALAWTLLRQGPYGGKPMAKRVLVVAPGSLVQNWGAEFNKWLGRERISVYAVDQVREQRGSMSYQGSREGSCPTRGTERVHVPPGLIECSETTKYAIHNIGSVRSRAVSVPLYD